RLHDQLENNASLATRDLERALADWDQQLAKLGGGQEFAIPPQAVALVVGERGIVARSGVALPFYPWVSPPVETSPALFADAESLEFERGNSAGAEAAYRRLAKSN